jgi:hypothetical protein
MDDFWRRVEALGRKGGSHFNRAAYLRDNDTAGRFFRSEKKYIEPVNALLREKGFARKIEKNPGWPFADYSNPFRMVLGDGAVIDDVTPSAIFRWLLRSGRQEIGKGPVTNPATRSVPAQKKKRKPRLQPRTP